METFLPIPPSKFLRANTSTSRWTCQTRGETILSARTQLLNHLASVPLATPTPADVTRIEATIQTLLQHRTIPPLADDLTEEPGTWQGRLNGRWNLAFSTEAPLRRILKTFASSLSENGVYQLLEDGKLQNVIATPSLALVVDGEYTPIVEDDTRKCPFQFRGTRLLTGAALKRFCGDDNAGDGGLDWKFGFAIGKGCFNVLWLDHSLRIDRDTSAKDRDWVNVYVYAGPVERCRAR